MCFSVVMRDLLSSSERFAPCCWRSFRFKIRIDFFAALKVLDETDAVIEVFSVVFLMNTRYCLKRVYCVSQAFVIDLRALKLC